MRTTTKTTIPAREIAEHKDACDRCRTVLQSRYRSHGEYEVVAIERVKGWSWPGESSSDSLVIDCCPACFDAYVLPALVALGFTPREEEHY